jgi:hypothetical protein
MRIRTVGVALLAMLPMGCSQQIPSAHPILISHARSIVIVLAREDARFHPTFDGPETQYCAVVVHNVSSRGVIA